MPTLLHSVSWQLSTCRYTLKWLFESQRSLLAVLSKYRNYGCKDSEFIPISTLFSPFSYVTISILFLSLFLKFYFVVSLFIPIFAA